MGSGSGSEREERANSPEPEAAAAAVAAVPAAAAAVAVAEPPRTVGPINPAAYGMGPPTGSEGAEMDPHDVANHMEAAASHGGHLLKGEGDAMAAYVQAGKRIPRRGEIGRSADEIQAFEDTGYVMSGSRHKRMNAVRLRKENQVLSGEESRALAMLNWEEKMVKEKELMAQFKTVIAAKHEAKP